MATRKGRRKKVFCRRAGGKVFGGVHLPLVGGQRWCYEFSPPQKGLPGDGHPELKSMNTFDTPERRGVVEVQA